MDLVRIVNLSRYLVVLLLLIGLVEAQTGTAQSIVQAMQDLCSSALSLLAISIGLLIIMSAIVYAAGQIMGAEARARATVWATAMMMGVVIGAIIYILLPHIISLIVIGNTSANANPCQLTLTP